MPLKSKNILSPKEASQIFSNLTMLLQVSMELLKDLEAEGASNRIGSIFKWMVISSFRIRFTLSRPIS